MTKQIVLLFFALFVSAVFADEICNSKFYKEKYQLITSGRMEITDVATEELRPYSKYENFKIKLPGRDTESIISVYGYAQEEGGFVLSRKNKEYVLYKELVDLKTRAAVLEHDTPLEKMSFDYFIEQTLPGFEESILQEGELVMLPDSLFSKNGSKLIYNPYRISNKSKNHIEVSLDKNNSTFELDIRDVYFSNISMVKEYSFYKAFFENGGEGKVIRYKADFDDLEDKVLGYDAISDQRAEIHYIAPTKLPHAETRSGYGEKIFKSEKARDGLLKLLDSNIPFYIVSRRAEWRGLALHSHSRLNRELQKLSGLPSNETVLFFDQNIDLVTVEHELQHLVDKEEGLRAKVRTFVDELGSSYQLNARFYDTFLMFILEYRAYKVGYDIYTKNMEYALGESYKTVFSKFYATPLSLLLESKESSLIKKVQDFLKEFCKDSGSFNLEEVFVIGEKVANKDLADINEITWKKLRARKMSQNSLADDAYTIQGRYYTHFNRFSVALPGKENPSVIRVYSSPEKVGDKEFVHYYEEKNELGKTILNTNEALKQLPYQLFKEQVQLQFNQEFLKEGSLVFLPESLVLSGGAERKLIPLQIGSIKANSCEMKTLGSEVPITISKDDIFYHNYSLIRDYEFLRSFYNKGGEGELVLYRSDDYKYAGEQEYKFQTGHIVEKPYIKINKMPDSYEGVVSSPELFKELNILTGNGVDVFLTPKNSAWHGYAPSPEIVFNMYFTDLLNLDKTKAQVFVANTAPFGTVIHEMKHALDYNTGLRDEFNLEFYELFNEFQIDEAKIYYMDFFSEYRAYQMGYKASLEELGKEQAQFHIDSFYKLHAKDIRDTINELSNGDEAFSTKLVDLLIKYCPDDGEFNLSSFLNSSD